jgi:hypothetical protein
MAFRSILKSARCVASSRLGQILFVIHLTLAVYAIAPKPPASEMDRLGDCQVLPVAGRAIRLPQEGPLLKILFVLDLPSLFVLTFFSYVGLLVASLLNLSLNFDSLSLLQTLALFILTGVQWWVTGFLIQSLMRRQRASRR